MNLETHNLKIEKYSVCGLEISDVINDISLTKKYTTNKTEAGILLGQIEIKDIFDGDCLLDKYNNEITGLLTLKGKNLFLKLEPDLPISKFIAKICEII